MRRLLLSVASCAALSACGGGPQEQFRFAEAVTACESLEWASTRAELLESGDTAQAGRYASGRCFIVEPARSVHVLEEQGGLFRGDKRLVLVETVDGAPLEHHAGAQFREVTGQEVPTRGWVRRGELIEVQ